MAFKPRCAGQGPLSASALAALGALLLALHSASAVPMNASDYAVMMQLKAQYGSKLNLSSWKMSVDCDAWDLVSCDGNRVSGLYFMRSKLGGPFPTIITQLGSMRNIYMDGNGFTGPFPSGLGQLQRLQVVRLTMNNLTGELPASMGGLRGLYKFGVKGNYNLRGTIPSTWAGLNLQEAYFEANQFSGPIPTCICNWTILQFLRLGDNKWTGTLPGCFSRLTNLGALYIDNIGPGFGGPIPSWIGNLQKLSLLFLNANRFTGPIPSTIGRLTNLDTLFLSANKIGGPLPKTMSNLLKLRGWVMEFNRITGTIPSEIGAMTNVERILLDNNLLTGTIPSTLGNLPKLSILLLEGNGLYGSVPTQIAAGCRSLVYFNLESNWLSGPPPSVFASTTMQQINIRTNFFIGGMNYRTTSGQNICPPLSLNSWQHSSTAFNCLTVNSTCGPRWDELQRRPAQCTNFCRADGPQGPCNGRGFCRFIKPRNEPFRPICKCFAGFRRTKNGLGCKR